MTRGAEPLQGARPVPVLLRADNFTPPARTPWGGSQLATRWKAGLALDPVRVGDGRIGESWEVSVEPSFPSLLDGAGGQGLDAAIAGAPEAWLGAEASARFDGQLPILVKLLDAAEPLSVQVHPADGDPALGSGESGKPEAWYILEARSGAGIFLGFREGVGREAVEACLRTGGRLDALMNFVPVAPGDVFVIEAGTAHAIGAGVTLLEPQFVRPGRVGVTYRFWDWNRRYDGQGWPSEAGEARELHVARSLAVTRWDVPGGDAFVAACRATPLRIFGDDDVSIDRLVDWRWFLTDRVWFARAGSVELSTGDSLLAMTCVSGEATLTVDGGASLSLRSGRSAVVPACVDELRVEGSAGCALIVTRAGEG